jgi:hypothetical protein
MKKIVKLVRLSSKEAFLKLRSIWEINCYAIWKKFKVTNLFLNHISWNRKNRSFRDVIQRLSSINLIEKISINWELVEKRNNIIIEWNKEFKFSYKIKYTKQEMEFFIVLWEKKSWEIILISVFLNYLE